MTLVTRRPTGLPSWPMMLLAGREGSGKSFAIAEASASPLVERTFWVGIGEDDPDEYGNIPGADFEIVEHEGTVADVIRAITDVATTPKADKPYLLGVDSATKMWDLIVDNAQLIANQRAKGRKTASGDYAISPDLWNVAANHWKSFMDAIRLHRGPSIITARLDEVMVMEDGQPTKEKKWKVQAHKSLVYDVGVIVEMHERGQYLLTKTKSLRLQLTKPTEAPDFTVNTAWERLGLTDTAIGERTFQGTVSDDPDVVVAAAVDAWKARAQEQQTKEGIQAIWDEAKAAGVANEVFDAIRKVAAEFQAKQGESQAEPESKPVTMTGTAPGKTEPRQWLREARTLKFAEEIEALWKEASALFGTEPTPAQIGILDELSALAAHAPSSKPKDDTPWAETAEGGDEWAAADAAADDAAAVEAPVESQA